MPLPFNRAVTSAALPWVIPPPPATRAEECQWVIDKTRADIVEAENRLAAAIQHNRDADELASSNAVDADARKALLSKAKQAFCEMRYLRADVLPQLREGVSIAQNELKRAQDNPAIMPKWQTDALAMEAYQARQQRATP